MTTEADKREEADLKEALRLRGVCLHNLAIVAGTLGVYHEYPDEAQVIDSTLSGYGWANVAASGVNDGLFLRTYERHAEAPDVADSDRAEIQAVLSDRANTAAALIMRIRIATYRAVCAHDAGHTARADEAYREIDRLTVQVIDLFTL